MALRSEKDRAKAQQEKFQAILSALLKDEDNKYCEDCDAKGPRWASWNLGIFLCIRCAGIHRNLGVHISRVKSVNLDSWTPEQIAMMQEMGNSRARAVYEANVPDTFRRPQTDSALEAFIRAKYEHKKYIAREWVPPKPVVPKEWFEDDKTDKKKARNRPSSNITLTSGPPASQSSVSSTAPSEVKARAKPAATVAAEPKPTVQPAPPKPKGGSDDLLGLDAEVPSTTSGQQGGDLLADLFGDSTGQGGSGQQNATSQQFQNGGTEPNLFDSGVNSNSEGAGDKKSAKDSIMALFGSGGGQQQMFGVPGGMYMPQQQMYGSTSGMPPMPQQQQGMIGQPMPQGMMGQSMPQGMMGMQQQPGAMFGSTSGQIAGNMMGGTTQQGNMMGGVPQQGPMMGGAPQQQSNMMGGVPQQQGNMMGGAQGMMMGRGGGQMFMQQQRPQQMGMPGQVNPMQQQMQFQQMQQQMANLTMGSTQMGSMGQQPQQTVVGAGGSWGSAGTGQTLSTNLWQ